MKKVSNENYKLVILYQNDRFINKMFNLLAKLLIKLKLNVQKYRAAPQSSRLTFTKMTRFINKMFNLLAKLLIKLKLNVQKYRAASQSSRLTFAKNLCQYLCPGRRYWLKAWKYLNTKVVWKIRGSWADVRGKTVSRDAVDSRSSGKLEI